MTWFGATLIAAIGLWWIGRQLLDAGYFRIIIVLTDLQEGDG